MLNLSAHDREQLRQPLQDAVVKCSERCQYHAAKWAAELLTSFLSSSDQAEPGEEDSQMTEPHPYTNGLSTVVTENTDAHEAQLESEELPRYLLAKSYFECREYDRCAAVFLTTSTSSGRRASKSPTTSSTRSPTAHKGKSKTTGFSDDRSPSKGSINYQNVSQKALFLALYAKFMAGEKRKDEDSEMIMGPHDGGATVNKELVVLGRILKAWFTQRAKSDGTIEGSQGWLEYLYGSILAKEKNDEEAQKWLVRSVTVYPYNWSAWVELCTLLGSVDELNQVLALLPSHIMTFVFSVYACQELYQTDEATHSRINELQRIFPNSRFLRSQQAILYYHSKDFIESEAIFSALLKEDPYCIDGFDHYSNILYVMQDHPKLAFLAQVATATDKFRPETCCVVGNYYARKSEHEKAVMYFRRALTLDRSFLSAWTLMGHEYVEMKNTHAAIESYRRAVDVNRKDYRAWYGLGQTYEVLEMHYYALFYYQRAASLRPYDPTMWQAVGACFNKMERPYEAIKALKRALIAGSSYGVQQDKPSSGPPQSSFSTTTSSISTTIPSSSQQQQNSSSGGGGTSSEPSSMDPEVLYQIALMYEKVEDYDEAAAYMELTLAQEEGERDSSDAGSDSDQDADRGGGGGGVGVTATTSKARMWLAKWEATRGGLSRAIELANELCQDGVEVEEAKALVRDLRSRMEHAT